MTAVEGEALLCAVQPHGEHHALVRLLTRDHGLLVGYVRGARSPRLRAALLPGNVVHLAWRSRAASQLASVTVDLVRSRGAAALSSRQAAALIEWATALVSVALPEQLPLPAAFDGLEGLLQLVDLDAEPMLCAQALVRFELALLAALGFGLDLNSCAATGVTDELVFVSPRSAQAVSHAAGTPWQSRMLRLPAFARDGSMVRDWHELADGLALSGHFVERQLLGGRAGRISGARRQLVAFWIGGSGQAEVRA